MSALQRVESFVEQYFDLNIVLYDTSMHTSEMAAQTLGVIDVCS